MTDVLAGLRVGFLGAGQMATALAKGILATNRLTAAQLTACDVLPAAAERFHQMTGARVVPTIAQVAAESDLLFLAVKPQQVVGVLSELRPGFRADQLLVSIAAGIPLATFADPSTGLGPQARLVRVMPNTPALIGAGASAYALGGQATPLDSQRVQALLQTVGLAVEVSEKHLDAVTGLSGSGPAYAYVMIEALSDGGVRMGLPRDLATRLAAQTLLGAAQMVLTTGQHPGPLKDAVTSPGGTTIAGLHALERGQLRGTLMNAVEAATERARQLAQG